MKNDRGAALRRRPVLFAALALLLAFFAAGLYNGLAVKEYLVSSPKLTAPVRLALVTDLHSCRYGEDQRTLLEAVRRQQPDLVLLAGDIFDDKLPDGNTALFLAAVAKEYPCYYVTGNHEYRAGDAAFAEKMEILARCGVVRLTGEAVSVRVGEQELVLCGVDDPDAWRLGFETDSAGFDGQVRRVRDAWDGTAYGILLSHRPERFALYAEQGFDLALCGHAHGGQWRIPGLLNGLIAPNQGLFPKYAGGLYRESETVMIVSRGLARESTRVPRFYNRPELVMIDLEPDETRNEAGR